jgi:hypothetical protein
MATSFVVAIHYAKYQKLLQLNTSLEVGNLREESAKRAAREVARLFWKLLPISDFTKSYYSNEIQIAYQKVGKKFDERIDLKKYCPWEYEREPAVLQELGKEGYGFNPKVLLKELWRALSIEIVLPQEDVHVGDDEAANRIINEWLDKLWPEGGSEYWRVRTGRNVISPENPVVFRLVFEPLIYSYPSIKISKTRPIDRFTGEENRNFNETALWFPNDMKSFCENNPYQARAAAATLRCMANLIDLHRSECERKNSPVHLKAVAAIVFAWWLKAGGDVSNFVGLVNALNLRLDMGKDNHQRYIQKLREKFTPQLYQLLQSGIYTESMECDNKTKSSLEKHFFKK